MHTNGRRIFSSTPNSEPPQQAELSTQLSEKLKARAQEFSALAAEMQESVGNFAADAANRATGAKKSA
jgi:hypothetical protein